MRRVWLAGWICLTLNGAFIVSAQGAWQEGTEPAAAAPQEPAASEGDTFEQLYLKWNELTAEANAKAEAFKSATDADRDAARTAYNDIVTQLEQLLPQLKTATYDRYASMEAPDEELTKVVLGMLIHDAASGKADDVLERGELLIAKRCPRELLAQAADAPRLGLFSKEPLKELLVRYDEAVADDLPRVKITTAKGEIVVELFENEAPNAVANFISLAEAGRYNGSTFHRVLENFVAQGGKVVDTEDGDPGYTIKCECYQPNYRHHYRGSLAMARLPQRDTASSQFYLVLERSPAVANLDGGYTVFGRMISGFEVLDLITRIDPNDEPAAGAPAPVGDTIVKVEVLRKRDHEYVPVTSANAPAGEGN